MTHSARCTPRTISLAFTMIVGSLATGCMTPPHREDVYVHAEDPGLPGLPTDNPVATRAYLAGLTFEGVPVVRTLRCEGNDTTTLRIYVERRSPYLSAASARKRGRIVARVVNAGPNRCPELYLDPNEAAYWWTGANRGLPLTTDFWRIPPSPGDTIRHLAQTGETNVYPDSQRTIGDAMISENPPHRPGDDGGDLAVPTFGHNSTWIACLGGCCQSAALVANYY